MNRTLYGSLKLAFIHILLVCFAASGLALSNAHALEEVAPVPEEKGPFSGSAEFSLLLNTGNSESKTVGASADFLYKPSVWSSQLKLVYSETEAQDADINESVLAELRGARDVSERAELFALLSYFENVFSGIDVRVTAESGAAYSLIKSTSHILKIQGGLGYTTEQRTGEERGKFATGKSSLNYRWNASKTAFFTNELTLFENLSNPSDWRIINTASIASNITERLLLKFTYAVTHLREPPAGFFPTDTALSGSVVTTF